MVNYLLKLHLQQHSQTYMNHSNCTDTVGNPNRRLLSHCYMYRNRGHGYHNISSYLQEVSILMLC